MQQAINLLPPDNHVLLSRAWVYLGLVNLEGDANKAHQALIQALSIAEAAGDKYGIQTVTYFLTWTLVLKGIPNQAIGLCRRALMLADEMPHWSVASFAHAGMGELLYEFNQLDEALLYLQKSYELAEEGGNADYLYTATLALARLHRSSSCCARSERELYNAIAGLARLYRVRGKLEPTEQYIEKAEKLAYRMHTPFLMELVTDELVRMDLAQNELDEARARVLEQDLSGECVPKLPYFLQSLSRTRVEIACHEPGRALQSMVPLMECMESAGMRWFAIQNLNLQALAFDMEGQADQALDRLARTLELAEPGGFMRTFLDEGPPKLQLLRHIKSRDTTTPITHYAARLLSAFQKLSATLPGVEQPLIEPLSKRELEVLRLIADGCSNKEIAHQLFITTAPSNATPLRFSRSWMWRIAPRLWL